MSNDAWWNDFYSETWSRVQGDGYPEERTVAECDLIEKSLGLASGARVLDIPCGIGRHSIELARRGYRVTGADLMPEFIAVAQRQAIGVAPAPRFVVTDMREFTSTDEFDGAFCYFGSFGYFFGNGDLEFTRAVARTLRPGARFVIETHIAETLLPVFRERDWFWADPPNNTRRVLEERHWDVENGRVEGKWIVQDDNGSSTSASTSIRIYTFRELVALLESAGFENIEARDGKTGDPLRVGSPRALVIGQRSTSR